MPKITRLSRLSLTHVGKNFHSKKSTPGKFNGEKSRKKTRENRDFRNFDFMAKLLAQIKKNNIPT